MIIICNSVRIYDVSHIDMQLDVSHIRFVLLQQEYRYGRRPIFQQPDSVFHVIMLYESTVVTRPSLRSLVDELVGDVIITQCCV